MKFRTPFTALAFSAITLLAGVGNAFAAVLVAQPYNAGETISQEFPDAPAFSTYAFDDFTLLQTQSLTSLQVFGLEQGSPAQNVAVTAQIWAALPDGSNGPLQSFAGTETVPGILDFNLGGFQLGAGTYWLTAFVTRESPLSGNGQWFIGLSVPTNGSEAYLYNPGGGLGFGPDPVLVNTFTGYPADLAFTLSGNAVRVVPEPASLALFGAALAALGVARRRRRL